MTYERVSARKNKVFARQIMDRALNYNDALSSVANRAFASPIDVPFRCRVMKLAVGAQNPQTGNVQVGLYDSAWNLICATAAVLSASLTAYLNWVNTTTNPLIEPGRYYVADVCNTVYAAGTTGIQFNYRNNSLPANFDPFDVAGALLVRMDAAYPLPALFVPVNASAVQFLDNGIEVAQV